MDNKQAKDLVEEDFVKLLEKTYEESENKEEIDFWSPYASLIMEHIELRNKFDFSQATLAEKLQTKQSVISRFENMGRLPSYDFLTRLSNVYKHKLGITLFGDFMAVVPLKKQELIRQWAKEKKQQTDNFVQELLEEQIAKKEKENLALIENANRSNVIEVDFTAPRKNNNDALNSTQDFIPVAPVIELKYAEA